MAYTWSLSRNLELKIPGKFDPILFILNRLLDLLLARLRARSLATSELHVRFELEPHEKDEERCKAPVGEPIPPTRRLPSRSLRQHQLRLLRAQVFSTLERS
jgi:hypothetical protein